MKNIETERKFIIKKPDLEKIRDMSEYTVSEIEQIYLASDTVTHRIRKRDYGDFCEYTENFKSRIDKMSAYESEEVIDEERYIALSSDIEHGTKPLKKWRHTFLFWKKTFEIDIYPEWKDTCILEVELSSSDEEIPFPPLFEIIKEVTGIKAYSNHSMAARFPKEYTE